MVTLSPQEIKALEQTRQRLSQLTKSLASLQQNILQSDPLPPWTSLQSLASVISQNLTSISAHLSTHARLLNSLAVFPLPNFPGKTQEPLLGQLLRKKLEPAVDDWVASGLKTGEEEEERKMEIQGLWNWAGGAANELARSHEWGGEFTNEEREGGVDNVVTGLRRRLNGEQDEDEEDQEVDVKGEDESVLMPLEHVLKFLITGIEVKL